jgi:hypothetical protein
MIRKRGQAPDPFFGSPKRWGKFNEELAKAGVLLAAEGLQPSSKGVRVGYGGKSEPSQTAYSPKPRS